MRGRLRLVVVGIGIFVVLTIAALGREGRGLPGQEVATDARSAVEAFSVAGTGAAPRQDSDLTGWRHHLAERCWGPFEVRDGRWTFRPSLLVPTQPERLAQAHCHDDARRSASL